MWAAHYGRTDAAQLLLEKGADAALADKGQGMTALIVTAANGKTETVKALLNRGASIRATDKEGKTALMWAARNGRQDVVPVLLEKGAEVNARDNKGNTALDLARQYRQEHTEALLLKAGANAGKGSASPETDKPGKKPPAAPPSGKGKSQGG
jgi:ankyrin repeat protein